MIDNIESFMNQLSDMDWGWWPFLFLRPDKTEDMTTLLVAKMSLYYGLPIGVVLALLFWEWWSIPFMIIFFFVFYRITFAATWNRRAQRLRNHANMEVV
jgi:hypothetical protein